MGCALASLVMILASCTNGATGLAGSDATSVSVSGSTAAGPERTTSAPSAPASGAPQDRWCRSRERATVRRVAYPMQKATDDLMRSLDDASVVAARRVAARAHLSRRWVLEHCDRLSTEMRQYLRVASRRSDDALSYRDLRAVMNAYTAWAEAVGEGKVAHDLRRSQQGCRELKRKVDASYRVWWRWTQTGRTWWIELRFRSRLTRTLHTSLDGRVRVTHLVGERVWSPRGYRRAGVMTWGGSSADLAVIRPGESRQLVAPGADPYVSVASDGVFSVERVEVTVGIPGLRSWWCSLPVPEGS